MQLVERKQTTNPTQRATRHGCFATAADFHPQASLAHFACGEMTVHSLGLGKTSWPWQLH